MLVACRSNRGLVERLTAEAVGRLRRHGVMDEAITIVVAPSAVAMLPLVRRAVADPSWDAVVVLGAIIQDGGTEAMVDASVIGNGLSHIVRFSGKPLGVGMLFAENWEQAFQQVGRPDGIGETAATFALEMYHADRRLSGRAAAAEGDRAE